MPDAEDSLLPDAQALLADHAWIAGLAHGLVDERSALEDLVQETRLRAWRRPAADPARAGGWVRRIVRNVALRWRSSDRARQQRESAVAAPESQPSTLELVARAELQRAVADAVLALAEPGRTAVLLRYFEQLPPRVIAARLRVPVETIRTRLKRSLTTLRTQLDARYGSRAEWSALLLPAGSAVAGTMAGGKVALVAALALLAGAGTWQLLRKERDPPPAAPHEAAAMVPAPDEPAMADTTEAPLLDVAQRELAASASSGMSHLFERVTFDGVVTDAASGAPIAGAELTIHYGGPSRQEASATTRSDANGRVELTVGPVGRDWYAGTLRHRDYARSDLKATELPPRAVALRPTVHLGTLALERGVQVRGIVVRHPEREPVAGATLWVSPDAEVRRLAFSIDAAVAAGVSDSAGRFELAERWAGGRGPLVVFAASGERLGFGLARAVGGQAPPDEIEVVLERPGALDVKVVDAEEAPVADADVVAYPSFAPFGMQTGRDDRPAFLPSCGEAWRSRFVTCTDSAGCASFESLPEGRVDPLFVNSPGYADEYRVLARKDGGPITVEHVRVRSGQRASVTVRLLPDVDSRVVGTVRDPSGAAVAGAVIRTRGFPDTQSDVEGRFATPWQVSPLDVVLIEVECPGFAPSSQRLLRHQVRAGCVPASLPDAARRREELRIDFTLRPAFELRGRVVDDVGEPVAGAIVRAADRDSASGRAVTLTARESATPASGEFVIDGASGDEIEIEALPPAGFLNAFPVRYVPSAAPFELVVRKAPSGFASLLAEVVDADSGAPLAIAGAHATALDVATYSIPNAVVSLGSVRTAVAHIGRWRLNINLADGRRAKAPFQVTSIDEEVRLRVAIGRPAQIEGRVTRGGRPVTTSATSPRLVVWIRADSNDSKDGGHALDAEGRFVSGSTDGAARLDPDGSFRVGNLPPGMPLRLSVGHFDSRLSDCAEATVILVLGESRSLELRLEPKASLEWRLAESLPPGRLVLATAVGDQPLSRNFDAPSGVAGTRLAKTASPPGRVRWRAEFAANDTFPPRRSVATGEVDVSEVGARIVDLSGFVEQAE